ncbi:hypothetical protein ACTA71_001930 [Dictyostelium dimigraforme]
MSAPSETTTTPTTPTTPAHRIFVGNLTENVESSALEDAFKEFGKVLSVRIIKKKFKSNTFGFVDMEDLETANKAVAAINGREFDGKQVNVEIAREKSTESRPKRTSTRNTKSPKVTTSTTTGENATESTEASPTLNGKTAKRRTVRRNTKDVKDAKANTTTTTDATPSTTTTTTAATSTAAAPATKTSKPKRERRPAANTADRQQSTTTLFVRNIPYSFDDAKLLETFKDYSPKSAHVIVNKYTNRSKGFGFVEFDDVANQQKGLQLNKLSVESRELSVKVALVPEVRDAAATTPDVTTTA